MSAADRVGIGPHQGQVPSDLPVESQVAGTRREWRRQRSNDRRQYGGKDELVPIALETRERQKVLDQPAQARSLAIIPSYSCLDRIEFGIRQQPIHQDAHRGQGRPELVDTAVTRSVLSRASCS